jgi:DNA-binding transcriptional MocR family regulator
MSNKAVRTGQTRVEGCVQWVKKRIQNQVFRPNMRVPSVRALARQRGISPFTVVEAYGRLVASGYLEARRGSGFYVLGRASGSRVPNGYQKQRIDLSWLMRNMLADSAARGPGLGVLPAAWLARINLAAALRSLGRQAPSRWLENGSRRGYEPLRAVLQQRLAALDILAPPEQIVLTTGITHALDLVLRTLLTPDATVLVLDPCWFGALGMLSAYGCHIVSVPCTPSGPDIAAMERAALEEKPRLLIISSVAQNPTGVSLSDEAVAHILDIARRHNILIFEDDVYADLCDFSMPRFAAADHLDRVLYAGSFSKTLASNIRVGFLVCRADLADRLADAKIVSGFTTPELNERLVHKLLVENKYARHAQRLQDRLSECRAQTVKLLGDAGLKVFSESVYGMFLWVQLRCDSDELAIRCNEQGMLLAPGRLFSPHGAPSEWMRINVTTDPELTSACIRSARSLGLLPRAAGSM